MQYSLHIIFKKSEILQSKNYTILYFNIFNINLIYIPFIFPLISFLSPAFLFSWTLIWKYAVSISLFLSHSLSGNIQEATRGSSALHSLW